MLFCRSKTKSASVAFFFLSSPNPFSSLSLAVHASYIKLRHEPTPGGRFPNLKSRSFSGPSQNLNNESVGPSSKTKQDKRNKETNKKHKKAVHFVWWPMGMLSVTGNCRNFRGKDPGHDGNDGNWAYIFSFLLQLKIGAVFAKWTSTSGTSSGVCALGCRPF